MYKIVAIGKNKVRVVLAEEKQDLCFETKEEAESFLSKYVNDNMLPSGYQWKIEKQ